MEPGYGRDHRQSLSECRYPEEVTDLLKRTIREMPEYRDCKVEDGGPFGLGCDCYISVKRNGEHVGYLIIRDTRDGWFEYIDETAPPTNAFPVGSLGDLNRFNMVRHPLPNTMEEILKLVFAGSDK